MPRTARKRWGEGLVWILVIPFEGREPIMSAHFTQQDALRNATQILKERIEAMQFADFEWGEEEAREWLDSAGKDIQKAWKEWYEFTGTEGGPEGFDLQQMEVQP